MKQVNSKKKLVTGVVSRKILLAKSFTSDPESTSYTLKAGSQLSQANNSADNPPEVDAICKRLERIKQSAF